MSTKPVPLGQRLRQSAAPVEMPAWLEAGQQPARTRPLRAHSAPVAPVQPALQIDHADVARQLDEARREAEATGLRAAEDRVNEAVERYCDGIRRLAERERESRRPDPAEVVDLALTIAHEIVRRETRADRDVLVRQIDAALAETTVDRSLVIRVATSDITHVRRARPDVAEAGAVLIEDPRLDVGDFIIETPQLLIDGTVAARLERVRAALVALVAESPPRPRPAPILEDIE